MSSIAVGSSSSSNGTSRNILKILSNRHRDSFNGLYAHFAEECSYFSNTPITSPNCADPFNSLANIKKFFSKRELKHIFKVLKGAYCIDVTIRLTSADRHEILANKVWQLCCHMTSGHNWQRVISNYTMVQKLAAKKKKKAIVKKRKKPPTNNVVNQEIARRLAETNKRLTVLSQLQQMGASRNLALEAVTRCGYNDVNVCVNYIFSRNTTPALLSSSSSSSYNNNNNNNNNMMGIPVNRGLSFNEDSGSSSSSSSSRSDPNSIQRITNQEEVDAVIKLYEEKGFPKSEFIVALKQAGGDVKQAVALYQKQKAEEAQQIEASQREQAAMEKKKKEQKELLKQTGKIIQSGFFNQSTIMSRCPSFKHFVDSIPNVDVRQTDFPEVSFNLVTKIRVYIIDLLKLEEQSFSWFKEGAKPFFEKVLSPLIESSFKKYSAQSQALLNSTFDKYPGRIINTNSMIYHPTLLEPIGTLMEVETKRLKDGLFQMPEKSGGLPPIFDNEIDKKEYSLDNDGIEFVQNIAKVVHEVSDD